MRKSLKYYLSYFLKLGTLVSTAGLVLSVLIQIYGRFLMENAPPWTEEASRFFFIYAISFAAGLAYEQNYYVFLDLITQKLNMQKNLLLEKVVNISVLILFALMTVFSVNYITLGLSERSPSLGINMAFSFFSMLILSASITVFSFLNFIRLNNRKL